MPPEARSLTRERPSVRPGETPQPPTELQIEPPSELQLEVIELFVRAVKVLGLPKSVGEIYGLLYISPQALPLDSIVSKLGISKGSASQGLRFLRNLGAIKPIYLPGDRRDHFQAVAELKKLAAGFISGELTPHLESGTSRLENLKNIAKTDTSPDADFYRERIGRLGNWRRRGGMLLKVVKRFLG